LLPDAAGDTVKLLAQISQQLDGLSNGTRASVESSIRLPPQSSFQPPTSAVLVNALWFLSLVISLFCALLATLQQRWARQYLYSAHPHVATHKRARIRSYFSEGIARFYAPVVVEAIPGLLHVSVFLFLAGFVISAFNIHRTVAYVVLAATIVGTLVYLLITVLPAIHHDSPYTSPFSALTWIISQRIAIGFHYIVDHVVAFFRTAFVWNRKAKASKVKTREFKNMTRAAHDAAADSSWEIDARALGWTLDKLDEPMELMQFAAGIPGFSTSYQVKDPVSILKGAAKRSTLHRDLYQHIFFLLMRASDIKLLRGSQLLSESERPRCKQICLKALYFFPGAIKSLLAHFTYSKSEKTGASLKPFFHSAESWAVAEVLSQRDDRINEDVTIGAQCVAAVQATRKPNEETRPILMRQLKVNDGDLQSYLDSFDNLLLKNLNNFLENTALKFIEQWKKPKKGDELEELTMPKGLEDNDMILSTILLLTIHIKDIQGVKEQLRKDYLEKWNKIKVCAGQALGVRSENAKKLLKSLHILPRYPSRLPTPPLNDPSGVTTPRSRDSYIEMGPLRQPAAPMSP